MAANDVMSHTEPNGQKVFDRLNTAGITWYAAGEIIAWNNYPTEALSVAESIHAWMLSPSHHDDHGLDRLQLRRFRCGRLRDRHAATTPGVFVAEPDETGAWAHFGTISKRSVYGNRVAGHASAGTALTHGSRCSPPAFATSRYSGAASVARGIRGASRPPPAEVDHLVAPRMITRSASGLATGPATGVPGG